MCVKRVLLCRSVCVRCERRLRLLFEQQLVGQGITFRPALESLVQHHTLGFSALELTGQLLCGTYTHTRPLN